MDDYLANEVQQYVVDGLSYKDIAEEITLDRFGKEWFDNKYDGDKSTLAKELENIFEVDGK